MHNTIQIQESEQELIKLLASQDNAQSIKKILSIYYVLKSAPEKLDNIAGFVAKDKSTISRWFSAYKRGGIDQLISSKRGKKQETV